MKRLFAVCLVIFLLCMGFFIWWQNGKMPVNSTDTNRKLFVITSKENIRDIGFNLRQAGLVRDPIIFFLTVKQSGLDGKIQAGDFRLSPSMTLDEIANSLTHGTTDNWVTITEGKRATEIAETLASKITTYRPSWKVALANQEGYLFPDTYLFPANADVNLIIKIMRSNFEKKYKLAIQNRTVKLTRDQAVIIASMVEREGKSPSDMKMIASVIENRLSIGMPLQVDATVQYALGFQPTSNTWWKKNLTVDDLKIDSAYNTYKNLGLPPGPICNPGLIALMASFQPAVTDYFYYFTDANGITHFAKTLIEQDANIAKYAQ